MVNKLLLLKLTVVILILFIAVVFVKPTIVGYSTYQQIQKSNYSLTEYAENVRDLQNSLNLISTNLSLQQKFTTQIENRNKELSGQIANCLVEKDSQTLRYNLSLSSCQETTRRITFESETQREECDAALQRDEEEAIRAQQQYTSQLEQTKEILQSQQQSFNFIIADAARRICCKEKVDDPQINSYDLFNNKIVCTEEGSNELGCFS